LNARKQVDKKLTCFRAFAILSTLNIALRQWITSPANARWNLEKLESAWKIPFSKPASTTRGSFVFDKTGTMVL
jgi:hypothetical protein